MKQEKKRAWLSNSWNRLEVMKFFVGFSFCLTACLYCKATENPAQHISGRCILGVIVPTSRSSLRDLMFLKEPWLTPDDGARWRHRERKRIGNSVLSLLHITRRRCCSPKTKREQVVSKVFLGSGEVHWKKSYQPESSRKRPLDHVVDQTGSDIIICYS